MTNDLVPPTAAAMRSDALPTQNEGAIYPALRPAAPLDVLSQIVQTYLSNFLSERTREAYEGDFRDFGAFITKTFGALSHPRDVTKTHVIAYRDFLRET